MSRFPNLPGLAALDEDLPGLAPASGGISGLAPAAPLTPTPHKVKLSTAGVVLLRLTPRSFSRLLQGLRLSAAGSAASSGRRCSKRHMTVCRLAYGGMTLTGLSVARAQAASEDSLVILSAGLLDWPATQSSCLRTFWVQ
jgi:hypothetical protein